MSENLELLTVFLNIYNFLLYIYKIYDNKSLQYSGNYLYVVFNFLFKILVNVAFFYN
jgi:hypothetical protein